MARKAKEKTEKAEKTKRKPPPMPKPDYGVEYVADLLGVTAFTCRQKLRTAGIEKSGRVYDFETKKKAAEVADQLKKIKSPEKKSKKD